MTGLIFKNGNAGQSHHSDGTQKKNSVTVTDEPHRKLFPQRHFAKKNNKEHSVTETTDRATSGVGGRVRRGRGRTGRRRRRKKKRKNRTGPHENKMAAKHRPKINKQT